MNDISNKISKAIVIVVVFFYIFSAFFLQYSEEISQYIGDITSTDYARITDIEYKAIVVDGEAEQPTTDENQSKVVITEKITFDVRAASKDNLFWELWLGLGEDEVDGLRRTFKVNSVKQILPNGTEVVWEEAPQLYWYDSDYTDTYRGLGPNKWFYSKGPYSESARRYECILFYVDGMYRDTITFEVEYEMYNTTFKYSDCAELYIPMYDGETCKYLESFKGEILIPNKDMPRNGSYQATGFGTDKGSFPLEESTTKHDGYTTFSFDLKEKDLDFLKGYEYLEFDMYAMGEDKHMFADSAPRNYYSSSPALTEVIANRNYYLNAPDRYNSKVLLINIIVLSISLIILTVSIFKLANAKRKYRTTRKSTIDSYSFRDIPRDIDPKFAAELVFIKESKPQKKSEDAVYAAILLSLARKKYIELTDIGSDTVIKILKKPQAPNTSVPQYTQPTNKQSYQGFIYSSTPYQNPAYPNQQYNPYYSYTQQSQQQQNTYSNAYQVQEIADDREPLTYCEQQYYGLLLRHVQGDSITISNLEKRISTDWKFANDFQNKISFSNINNAGPQAYTSQHKYDTDKIKMKKRGKNFIVWGSLLLTIGNLISMGSFIGKPLFACCAVGATFIALGIYHIVQSKHFVSLTHFGEQEYQKWRGLYNFLKSDTLLTERTHIELPLWEKYLVYATAFGISEKVINAIRIRCITVPPQTSIANTSTYRIRHIHSRSSSIRRTIHSSSHSYRTSSYGGGYNAGGRGIGGGGGGH